MLLPSFAFATNYIEFQNSLYSKYENAKKTDKYTLVKNFCDEIVKKEKFEWKFETKKSLFLQVLCDSTWIWESWDFDSKIQLKWKWVKFYTKLVPDSRKKHWAGSWIFSQCEIKDWINTDRDSMNNVDFACVAWDIFRKLANDYVNVATYFAYGWFKWKDNMKKFEKDFYLWKRCPQSYIHDESSDEEFCKHPKTYKYYRNLVAWLNAWLKKMDLIQTDAWKIYDDFEPEKTWSQAAMYMMSTKDYIYNELYFYSIFVWYYSTMIDSNTWKFQLKSANRKDLDKNTKSESIMARNDLMVARSSVKKSFTVIKDIYRTFPIHLGYRALYEDIGKLRKSFAKLYTPLDQFRYKLKNVQDEDKY